MAQFGSAPALGAGGRRFESFHSDQYKRDSLKKDVKHEKITFVDCCYGGDGRWG